MMPVSEAKTPGADAPVTLPWSPAGWWLVAGAVLVTAAIVFVWRPPRHHIVSLLGVLAGAVLWSVCSALELSAGDLTGREYWGDLKYVGVVLLPPAYLAFVLQCSGTPLATVVGRRWPWSPGRAAPAGRHRHPRPGPLLPSRGDDRHRPGGRGGPAVLAPPDRHRHGLGGDGAAGGDPEPDVGAVPAPGAVLVAAILLPIATSCSTRVGPFRQVDLTRSPSC